MVIIVKGKGINGINKLQRKKYSKIMLMLYVIVLGKSTVILHRDFSIESKEINETIVGVFDFIVAGLRE